MRSGFISKYQAQNDYEFEEKTSEKRFVLMRGSVRGIGYARAKALFEDGFEIFLADISSEGMASATQLLGAVAGIVCDMGNPDQVSDMFEQIATNYGPLHALVNNAGIAEPGDFLSYTFEVFEEVISVC